MISNCADKKCLRWPAFKKPGKWVAGSKLKLLLSILQSTGSNARRLAFGRPARGVFCTAIIIGLLFLLPCALTAGELTKVRIRAGLDLFPSLLAADSDINNKKNNKGELELLILYRNNKNLADEMAAYLKRQKTVKGTLFSTTICSYKEIEQFRNQQMAGVFLVQQSPANLKNIINFGKAQKIIIFSPFPGDVEKGGSSGLIISDIMQPYLNIKALKTASIRIKPFFLRVAESI